MSALEPLLIDDAQVFFVRTRRFRKPLIARRTTGISEWQWDHLEPGLVNVCYVYDETGKRRKRPNKIRVNISNVNVIPNDTFSLTLGIDGVPIYVGKDTRIELGYDDGKVSKPGKPVSPS